GVHGPHRLGGGRLRGEGGAAEQEERQSGHETGPLLLHVVSPQWLGHLAATSRSAASSPVDLRLVHLHSCGRLLRSLRPAPLVASPAACRPRIPTSSPLVLGGATKKPTRNLPVSRLRMGLVA